MLFMQLIKVNSSTLGWHILKTMCYNYSYYPSVSIIGFHNMIKLHTPKTNTLFKNSESTRLFQY